MLVTMTFHRALGRLHQRYLNRTALRLAGHGSLADLEHVGRRSGVVRHTPLRAFRSQDSVVVGINFGTRSDWLQNLRAAGRGRMLLKGELLELGAPTVVPVREGVRGMPWWFGLGLRFLVRTRECVVLPVLAAEPASGPASEPASEPASGPAGTAS